MWIDIAGIFTIYGVYAGVAYLIFGPDPDDMMKYGQWALVMIGVSLLCTLVWYALGEWGIKPFAPRSTWMAAWFLLLATTLVTAAVVTFLDKDNPVPWLNFLGGFGAYYFASVLFSPAGAKYLIWPAKLIRTW
jgi:hypothetical protein